MARGVLQAAATVDMPTRAFVRGLCILHKAMQLHAAAAPVRPPSRIRPWMDWYLDGDLIPAVATMCLHVPDKSQQASTVLASPCLGCIGG